MKLSTFSKIVIASSSIIITAAVTMTTIFFLNDNGVITLHDDKTHYYQADFYVDDTLVFSEKLPKGAFLEYPYSNMPMKDDDADGTKYQFIGWDLLGNGIVDIVPANIYSNISARAIFTPYTLPDIDLSNIDLYQLLQLLEDLDIDLESFINFFGLDWEDLMELIGVSAFRYTTDYSGIVYFRSESFGNYNSSKFKWNDADFFDTTTLTSGINPLQFSADKMSRVQNSYDFNIIYDKRGKKYPVVNYESFNNQGLQTDSYSLTEPINNEYFSAGFPYYPATSYSLNLLKTTQFSSSNLEVDEQNYREYAYSKYLTIEDKYQTYFSELNKKYGISYQKGDYTCLDYINSFYFTTCTFNYMMKSYPKSKDPIIYFLDEAHEGTSRHFASASTLWFRSLGIPARYCQGYISYSQAGVENTVNALQSHSWCEIYIDGLGWIQFDPSLQCLDRETLLYMFYGIDPDDIEIDEFANKTLEYIEVEPSEDELVFFINDEVKYDKLKVLAYYDDKSSRYVKPTFVKTPSTETEGKKNVLVFYNEGNITKYATYQIEVIIPKIVGIRLYTDNVQRTFYKGNKFNYDGLKVFLVYENKRETYLFHDVLTISEPDLTKLGTHTVTVSYTHEDGVTYTASYEIEVKVDGVIGVELELNKTTYFLNEEFDYESMIISLIYSQGGREPTEFVESQMSIEGFSSKTEGTKKVKLKYINNDGNEIYSNVVIVTVKDKPTATLDISKNLTLDYTGREYTSEDFTQYVKGLRNGDRAEISVNSNGILLNPATYRVTLSVRILDYLGNDVTESEYKEIKNNNFTIRVRITPPQLELSLGYNEIYLIYLESSTGKYYYINEKDERVDIFGRDPTNIYNISYIGLASYDSINIESLSIEAKSSTEGITYDINYDGLEIINNISGQNVKDIYEISTIPLTVIKV